MIDVEHSSATYYYHHDALGNVVALSNAAGSTVEIYEYSVFGEVAASDQTNPNPFMFTGREFDKETGLYFYRARYYAPEIGRFLQTDPIGYKGGMDLYTYCKNSPWNLTDPLGQDPNGADESGSCACGDPCDAGGGLDPCAYGMLLTSAALLIVLEYLGISPWDIETAVFGDLGLDPCFFGSFAGTMLLAEADSSSAAVAAASTGAKVSKSSLVDKVKKWLGGDR
jgi:RHS repeat-associated protein